MITNLRRRAASSTENGGSSLPYDAEIAYLQSTGTQYIDTGIKLYSTGTGNYEIDIKLKSCKASEVTTNGAVIVNSMREVSPYPGSVLRYVTNSGVNWAVTGQTQSKKADFDSFSELQLVISNHSYSHNVSTTVFAGYDGNGSPWRYSKVAIYYLKIYNNGTLVRDYIPVRVGQVGYLYDKVSGQLFGNLGTGSFTLGPDVGGEEPVEPTCLALLHFDDSTDPFKDEMGNTWTISGTRSTTSNGKWSNCLDMSESSSSTKVTKSAYMSLPASDFTIDFWMKGSSYYQSGYNNWRAVVRIEDGSSNIQPKVGNGDNSSHWYFSCVNADNIYTTRSTSEFSHHVIEYSFSTNQMRYYYNGTLQGTRSYTFANPNNLILRVGESTEVNSPQAYLDELRVMSGCVYNGNSYTVPVSPYEYEA